MANDVRIYDLPASGYESITVTNAAVKAFTAAKCGKGVHISVETEPIRYRMDGTDPTTSEGHILAASATLDIFDKTGANIENFRMIATGSDSTVKVTHF